MNATLDDARLVELGRGGDREAFAELVARYQSPLCAMAYSACGDVQRSEDLAQEAFLVAWKSLRSLKEPGSFRPWLFGITRNLINHSFRQLKRNPITTADLLEDALPDGLDDPSQAAVSKEEQEILWRCLEKIPETYREPLVLFYREDQSITAVAQTLGISEDAVRQRLSRGRNLIHARISRLLERALVQTRPTQTFTLSVVAALPAMTTGVAGSVSLAGKVGAAGKALFILPFLTFVGMWMDYRLKKSAGESRDMLRRLKIYYIGIAVSVAAVLTLAWWQLSNPGNLDQENPGHFAFKMVATFVGYPLLLGGFAAIVFRGTGKVLSKATEPTNPLYNPAWEYCSETRFLGLPLVHIRFGNWYGKRFRPWIHKRPVIAWIAISDTFAFGGLFAYGATAVAPLTIAAISIGLFAYGGWALGVVSLGGFSFGVFADGPFAFGYQAFGDYAFAWHTALGKTYAVAKHYAYGDIAHAREVNTEFVEDFYTSNPFFRMCTIILPYIFVLMFAWMIPMTATWIAQTCTILRRRVRR